MSDLQKLFDDYHRQCFVKPTESTSAKISKSHSGKKSTMLGKNHTQKSRDLISKNSVKSLRIMTPLGEFHSIGAAARAYNITTEAMRYWIRVSKKTEFFLV